MGAFGYGPARVVYLLRRIPQHVELKIRGGAVIMGTLKFGQTGLHNLLGSVQG
jgi:hypothetical protein